MSKSLPELLDDLSRLSFQVHERDEEIRQRVLQLSDQFKELCQRAETGAHTEDFVIEVFDVTNRAYGHLGVGPEGIYLAHRSTQDDLDDELYDNPEEVRGYYRVVYPKEWDVRWLRVAATEARLCELAESLQREMQALLDGRITVATNVQAALRAPPSGMQEGLIAVAEKFGFARVIDGWGKAQRLQSVDPSAAITAASSLLETTLKHIIDRFNIEMPSDQSIQRLCRAVSKAFDFPGESDEHVKGLLFGLSSAVQNIGALRTKTGDAHGRTASSPASEHDLAQFAVTAAGAVSTFLLRRAQKMAVTQPPA
jgi:hypothetical protein